MGRSRHAVAPAAKHDRVELLVELVDRDIDTYRDAGAKLGALRAHLVQPPFEETLLHLELGDAVTQQAADAVRSLEDHDPVAGARELLRGRESGGARAHDRDTLPGEHGGRLRLDPSLVPGPVDDLDLDLLDRHRIAVDAEHARGLARSRAQPTRELGEVVRRVKPLDRLVPAVSVDEVVPVGDQVAERTTVVAEGDAAVHAPTGLVAQLLFGERLVNLVPVEQPHGDGASRRPAPRPLEKAGDITHGTTPSLARGSRPREGPAPPPAASPRARACSPSA